MRLPADALKELTDFEWNAIKPHLPNKPLGVPRVDDRRVLNGIFWVLRSGAPWGDLPGALRPEHDGLQSLQPTAEGWRLRSPDGCHRKGA